MTAAGQAKQMLTLILLSGNKTSQPTGASRTSPTLAATCVAFCVWSEARWNCGAREASHLSRGRPRGRRRSVERRGDSSGAQKAWPLGGTPCPAFPTSFGAEGARGWAREVGSSLHSNLLGCGWEMLRPTVLTISPCSHEPHREQERERGGVERYQRQICGQRISPDFWVRRQLTCGEGRLCVRW